MLLASKAPPHQACRFAAGTLDNLPAASQHSLHLLSVRCPLHRTTLLYLYLLARSFHSDSVQSLSPSLDQSHSIHSSSKRKFLRCKASGMVCAPLMEAFLNKQGANCKTVHSSTIPKQSCCLSIYSIHQNFAV